MLRRSLAAVVLFAALASLAFACSQPSSCPDAESSAPAQHRLGWAPPGATAQNYVGLAKVSGVVKAGPATALQLYAVNRNASARYLQVWDSTSAVDGGPLTDAGLPITDAAPTYQYLLPATSAITVPILPGGQSFTTGVSYGVSTVPGFYTPATAADHDVEAVYQ